MSSKLGTPLAPKRVAWVWFAVAAGLTVWCAWEAIKGQITWTLPAVFAGIGVTSRKGKNSMLRPRRWFLEHHFLDDCPRMTEYSQRLAVSARAILQ